jgi:hypothetical protein
MDAVGRTSLADRDFRVVADLSSATLDAAVNVCDLVSTACFDVVIDLTWTATGASSRSNGHLHSQELGLVINSFGNGASRLAQASGSVSNGVTNFTPNPGLAHIQSHVSGMMTVSLPG